jgi:chromosome segregation ATPase
VKLSEDRFTRLDDRMKDLLGAQKATEGRLGELAGAQRAADERSARLDERMMELAAAQKATEERLNALINVLERHITGPDHAARP